MIVILFVDLNWERSFCVDVKVIVGLKFWFEVGEIKYSVFVIEPWTFWALGTLTFFIYLKSFESYPEFLRKLNLFRFLGVFIVLRFNDVSFLVFDFNRKLRVSEIEFELIKSPLVLCLSVFSVENANLHNYYGLILSLKLVFSVLVKKSIDELFNPFGINFWIGTDKSCFPSYFSVFALQGVFPVSI